MFLTTLCFIASLLGCREAEIYSERRLTERIENWQVYVVAAVVQGEAGDDAQAQSLVAWTLRAWWDRARFGFEHPPRSYGWYGWARPGRRALIIAASAFGLPPDWNPWPYCAMLGNDGDLRVWAARGWPVVPDLTVTTVYGGRLNCLFSLPRKQKGGEVISPPLP